MNKQIEIYKAEKGDIVFNVSCETIWTTEDQIAKLFGVDRSVINRHIRNIYRDGELQEKTTCAKNAQVRMEGNRQVTREVRSFNLDMIISIGYRVNSRKATDFRIWATKTLKTYLVDGVAVNEKRLKELDAKKLTEIEGALSVVRRLITKTTLSADEATGVLEVISRYDGVFKTLKEYDEGHIVFKKTKKAQKRLEEGKCLEIIAELKRKINGDELFGRLRKDSFSASLGAVYQTFNGKDVYASIAEKAANLLYLIIKDHPFYDGNKRIGAFLFIVFLTMNDFHLAENGEVKISDRALTALALLIAESDPSEKELIVALVCKMLEG